MWQQQGEAAFLTHWPTLHAGLDALPLTDMPEASVRLAEMVIKVGDLPEAIVIELRPLLRLAGRLPHRAPDRP
jgi:hypothetical protein